MCRTGGRRCDTKWDDAHRERYNARRRIERNGKKADAARAADNESKASYYERLVNDAQQAAGQYDKMIREHEAKSGDSGVEESIPRPTPPADASDHPLSSKPSEPMDMDFVRNPVSSTAHVSGNDFGQDIEPSGRYLTKSSGFVPDGWESGSVRFEKPLHVNFGASGLYSNDDNWKRRLSAHYDGKTGKVLSGAVRSDGYDAIVTHDKYGTSEIVDLTGIGTKAARAKAETA